MTPEMEKGNYTLLVEVTGIKPVWTDKSKQSMEVTILL